MTDKRPTHLTLFLTALKLGCTSFGGPIAHLAYFHDEYVTRRGWTDEESYADLVALCQFLPGPASSQVGFGVGLKQRGLVGGLLCWVGFTLPSALLMIGFGYGVSALGGLAQAGWVHGLNVAAVAVVAQAVILMGRRLCPDLTRATMAGLAGVLLLFFTAGWVQLTVLLGGGLAGWSWLQQETVAANPDNLPPSRTRRMAFVWLLLFLVPLLLLPLQARLSGHPAWLVAGKFYEAGALVFGGGHVILPLLQDAMVTPGWLSPDCFLAGYGAAQALPGPLLTFAASVGTVISVGPGGWVGGVWALAWVFAPALLIVLAVLPWWNRLRAHAGAQAALRGANAAVVGLLAAALINPIGVTAITGMKQAVLALVAFGCLHLPRVPVWAVVAGCALLGQLFL